MDELTTLNVSQQSVINVSLTASRLVKKDKSLEFPVNKYKLRLFFNPGQMIQIFTVEHSLT